MKISILSSTKLFIAFFVTISPSHVINGREINEETCAATSSDGSCIDNDIDCVDQNEDCLMWAEYGECQNNEVYMNKHCMMSCEVCSNTIISSWRSNKDCMDRHPICEAWALHGECITNPTYMLQACSKACNTCIDVEQSRNEGMEEDEIFRRYIFAIGNWGKPQAYIGNEIEKVEVKKALINMKNYALNNATALPLEERLLCNNLDENCAFWASKGLCEDNLPLMMDECALACRYCHMRKYYIECSKHPFSTWMDDSDHEDFQRRWIERTYNSIIERAPNKAELVTFDKKEVVDSNDPWVLKINNFISSDEADKIVHFAKTSLEWQPSPLIENIRRDTRSAFCNTEKCRENHSYQRIRKAFLNLFEKIEDYNMEEPMEIVHYQEMQSFGAHHDFDIHDTWKPGGPRALSFFLCLSDIGQGGAIGFPDLDWLSITPNKGQLLIWPNINIEKNKENNISMTRHEKMSNEGLPVITGEKYGLQTWIHLGNYNEARERGCV